jgi:hypothetical protein
MAETYQFIYWTLILIVLLVALFFTSRLARNFVARRVRRIREFGMDFDAVSDMLKKGLLSPDEAKRVKAVLTRHFSRLYSPPESDKAERGPGGLPADVSAALQEPSLLEGPPHKVAAPPAVRQRPAVAAPSKPPEPSVVASREQPSDIRREEDDLSDLPLDVVDMYQAGQITHEEFVALRRFYAERKRPQ